MKTKPGQGEAPIAALPARRKPRQSFVEGMRSAYLEREHQKVDSAAHLIALLVRYGTAERGRVDLKQALRCSRVANGLRVEPGLVPRLRHENRGAPFGAAAGEWPCFASLSDGGGRVG